MCQAGAYELVFDACFVWLTFFFFFFFLTRSVCADDDHDDDFGVSY
jgi:hypothetical protein